MIRHEARLFVCAVQFLTRIPTPQLAGFQPEWIQQSARYYPLVGQIVGGVSALILYGAAQVWSPWIAALLAVPLVKAACALLSEVAELAEVLEAAG